MDRTERYEGIKANILSGRYQSAQEIAESEGISIGYAYRVLRDMRRDNNQSLVGRSHGTSRLVLVDLCFAWNE